MFTDNKATYYSTTTFIVFIILAVLAAVVQCAPIAGKVTFYDDVNFKGEYYEHTFSNSECVQSSKEDKWSSVTFKPDTMCIHMFVDSSCRGFNKTTRESVSDLSGIELNDNISSFRLC